MRLFSRKAPRAAEPRTGKLKLVLHVGPYKTGTTSLQKALLKQHGSEDPQAIWYPLPEDFGPGHASKVWKMLGQRGNSPSPAIGLSVEHAKKTLVCQCLILSSEVFAGTFPNRVQPLVEQTADTDMHIVITLSPIGRRAVSTWQETVKHRSLVSLDDALDAVLKGPGLKPHFVRFFADHFPEAKISVIVADRKAPESLYGMFGEATGIPLATPRTAKELVANRSLGLIEAKILSSFNAGAKEASLTLENYRKARSLLRNQFESEGWRAVVPMIPLTLPSDWVGPLRTLSTATIADIKELEAKGRITVFVDIESLDDLEPCPEESDTPRDGKEPA